MSATTSTDSKPLQTAPHDDSNGQNTPTTVHVIEDATTITHTTPDDDGNALFDSLLFPCSSIIGGGVHITIDDIVDINTNLITTLPSEMVSIVHNVINFGFKSLHRGTRWYFQRDGQTNTITAALMSDLRDNYIRLFCTIDHIEDLITTALDPNAEVFLFCALPRIYVEPIMALMAKQYHRNAIDYPFSVYHLYNVDKFRIALAKIPSLDQYPGFVCDTLRVDPDARYVDATWTYHDPDSYHAIAESIYSRVSTCIRTTTTTPTDTADPNQPTLFNNLVGWVICRSDFSHGVLKVEEAFRGQGFGKWLSAIQPSQMLQVPLSPELTSLSPPPPTPYQHPIVTAYIDSENIASQKLHENLGFDVQSYTSSWMRFNRPDLAHRPVPKG